VHHHSANPDALDITGVTYEAATASRGRVLHLHIPSFP
jgi:hypothetical protein